MACDLTKGRGKVCKDGLGGQKNLYLYNSLEDAFTVVDSVATAVNASLTTVFKYELEGDGNTLTQNVVGDRATSTRVNTQTLTTVLKKIDAATNAELNLLIAGYPQAVVEDRNGNFHALGLDDGIDFTADASTGGAKTDGNLYTLTGVATTSELAPILDAATVTAFLALV